jgi:hypothetical protein
MANWKDKERAIRSLEKNGKVDPEDLIAAARNPTHPCHGDFTWDINKAAEKCWRDEARRLIRMVGFTLKVEDSGQRVVNYVASGDDDAVFVSVPKIRGKGHVQAMLLAEVAQLEGAVSRAYGLALSKSSIIGVDVSDRLKAIRDLVSALKADLE